MCGGDWFYLASVQWSVFSYRSLLPTKLLSHKGVGTQKESVTLMCSPKAGCFGMYFDWKERVFYTDL